MGKLRTPIKQKTKAPKPLGQIGRLRDKVVTTSIAAWDYWRDGIWADMRQKWWVNLLKTLNISVNSFTDTNLQSQACAMAYRTTLAIIPALGLLLAIGRGFGLNDFISDELYSIFPGQEAVIAQALDFVNRYLSQSAKGVFMGVGILFLLYTLYTLINSVESTFNRVWAISQSRSVWRKITDYTAMMFILPILLICAGGLNTFLSSTIRLYFEFLIPLKDIYLVCASWLFTWLFFAACYKLIPNTKVKFKNALIAGILAGTSFKLLQWLFVSGQLYVTKYNAIYGSFAFLPLMLLWIQLTWVITLIGALVCYSSQSISLYSLSTKIDRISPTYHRKVIIVIMTLIVKRFVDGKPALTEAEITECSEIPPRLVSDTLTNLIDAGLVTRTVHDTKKEIFGFQPAIDTQKLTVGYVMEKLSKFGNSDFIPGFSNRYGAISEILDNAETQCSEYGKDVLISSLEIKEYNS